MYMVRRTITISSGLETMIQEFRGELMTIVGGNISFNSIIEQMLLLALTDENKQKQKNMHKKMSKVTEKMKKEFSKLEEEFKLNM